MNKMVGTRDKKVALLLATVFAWLFIGSLIIFHQEHVLGKHIKLNTNLFISPKSKDNKDDKCLKLSTEHVSSDFGGIYGILSDPATIFDSQYVVSRIWNFLPSNKEESYLACLPLRAPPVL